jgi:YD repeat-containing protein
LTTRISEEPLNFATDGGDSWRLVDNRLIATSGTYAARNAANAYEARLPRSLADPVVFAVGQRWVSFALAGAQTPAPVLSGETATYRVSSEVTARYTMRGSGVREALSLASASAPNVFRYRIDASSGLTPRLTREGGIVFTDGEDRVRFGFSAPTLVDAKGAAGQASFSLEREASGSTLTVTADRDWLRDGARAFPVVLDPDVFWADPGYLRFSEADQDCYLESSAPAASTCSLPNLKVGRTPAGQQKAILRFAVEDAIPASAQVLDARFGLVLSSRTGSPTATNLELHRLTVPWTNAATWDTSDGSQSWPSNAIDPAVAGPASTMGQPNQWYEWEPTELVQEWIAGRAPNHGMALQAAAGSPENQFEFTSSDGFSTEVPYLDVKWLPAIGQVGHYTLLSAPGTETHHVKVNVANGNIRVDATDAPLDGFGEGLARSFNTLGTWFIWAEHGPGWSPHLEGGLHVEVSDRDGSVQVGLTDGAAITFFPNGDGSYRSSEPDYASLRANADGSYTLHVNDGSETGTDYTSFPNNAEPRSAQRGTSTVTVGQEANFLRTITDSSGTALGQQRDQDGYTTSITDQGSGRDVSFTYRVDGTLTTATAPERASDYIYDGFRGPLTSIVETPGASIAFEYDAQGRATAIRRTTNGTTDSMTFDYQSATAPCDPARDAGKTTVRTPEGTTWHYCYDARLNVTESVKDENIAPDVALDGTLADRDAAYMGVGTIGLSVAADDAGPAEDTDEPVSGVKTLAVKLNDGTVLATANANCASGCPATFAHDFTIATGPLPEGMLTFVPEASDAAFNVGEDAIDVALDKTAPTPPSDLEFDRFDEGAQTVQLSWLEGDDPDLADGTLGAGVKYTEYRRKDANGNWGDWHRFEDDTDATLGNVSDGEEVDVQMRSIDSVGNTSTAVDKTLTVHPDEAPSGQRREAADVPPCSFTLRKVRAVEQRGDFTKWQSAWMRLGAQLEARCSPRLGEIQSIEFEYAAFAEQIGTDAEGKPIYKDHGRISTTTTDYPNNLSGRKFITGFWTPCDHTMTGNRRWYVHGTVIYHKIIGQSREEFSTFPTSQLKSCPSLGQLHAYQAGAWRAIARREAVFPPFEEEHEDPPLVGLTDREPSKWLGKAMGDPPDVPPNTSRRGGWPAHHIIPIGKNYAKVPLAPRDLQALMFRACVHPNEPGNGAYLRGFPLRVRLEDGMLNPKWEWLRDNRPPLHLRFLHADTTGQTYLPTLRALYLLSQIPIEDQRDPQDGTCRTRLLQGYRKELLKSLSDIRRDLYDHSMNLTATPN